MQKPYNKKNACASARWCTRHRVPGNYRALHVGETRAAIMISASVATSLFVNINNNDSCYGQPDYGKSILAHRYWRYR